MKAGVNVFRLNFSHGTHEDKKLVIDHIRKINKTEPYNVAILGDLQGPKLRVGEIEGGSIDLAEGDQMIFSINKCLGTKKKVYVSYPMLTKDVSPGEKILLDDGKIEVVVREMPITQ